MSKKLTRRLAAPAIGASGLTAVAALHAVTPGAATGPVNITEKCSGSSIVNLQPQRDHTGRISIDLCFDMAKHKAGATWKVVESDNGTVFVNGTTKTIGDGSFSSIRPLAPAPGLNTVAGKATNPMTGERCTISAGI